MDKVIEAIKNRYFRKVIAYPKGIICHFGDCSIYHCYVCDCGLIRDLKPVLCSMAPGERKKFEKTMLPKGFSDDSYAKHEVITAKLYETDLYSKWWKEAQDYAKAHPVTQKQFRKMLELMGFKIGK